MKNILILLFLAFSLNLNAQEIDTNKISHQLYNDVKNSIISLSSALAVGAEHVYVVIVKQQYVRSVLYLIVLSIGFIALLYFKQAMLSDEEWTNDQEPTIVGVYRIGQLLFGLVMFIIGLIYLPEIVTGFTNPEFGAINYIIQNITR